MRKLFIVTGEHSGDMHAANIVKELRKTCPNIEIQAIGGKNLEEQGVTLFRNHEKMSVMGLTPKAIWDHLNLENELVDHFLNKFNPDLVLLVDYGMFNLRLAKRLKKHHLQSYYFISPQVWASRKGRINKIKKYVSKLMLIFPFEEKMFQDEGVDATYVGHPLISNIQEGFDKEEFYKHNSLDPNKKLIGLFPGSRKFELNQMMSVYFDTIKEVFRHSKKIQFCISQADSIKDKDLEKYIKKLEFEGIPVKTIKGQNHALLACSDAVILTSGTVTLEAALYETPMVVCYKGPQWMYWIYLMLRDIKQIALPNIIAGKEIVKELVQKNATPEKISIEILSLLHNSEKREKMISELKEIKDKFGDKIASEEVANIIRKHFEDSDKEVKQNLVRGKYRGLKIKEKSLKEQLTITVVGRIVAGYLCGVDLFSGKRTFDFNPEIQPSIYAMWHGDQYAMGTFDFKLRKKIHILVSPSNDGEMISVSLNQMGFSLIRGSRGRDGFQATQECLKSFENGDSIAFMVDGPKGPPLRVKMGVIKLAQMGQVPIIPLVPYTKYQYISGSWDKCKIPLPFSRLNNIYGDPIYIPQDATKEELEGYRQQLEDSLFALDKKIKQKLGEKNG